MVLGSAQVQLPEDIRAAFRMAGLSHALAASGLHLSVLLGSGLMLARRWPPGLRLPLAATALLLFLCLAGSLPGPCSSVVHPCGGLALDAAAAVAPFRCHAVVRAGCESACCPAAGAAHAAGHALGAVGSRGAYGCAAPDAVACSSVGGPGDHHGQLDQPLAWGSTAHRTSPGVGGCPAGAGLAALVACWGQGPVAAAGR